MQKPKVQFLMKNGSIVDELTVENQKDCRGIIVHQLYDTIEELLQAKKEWEECGNIFTKLNEDSINGK